MSTLINRLFTKNEDRITNQTTEPSKAERFFAFLIDKGAPSLKLTQLSERCNTYISLADDTDPDYNLVQLYLDIENYLLFHDSRFISTQAAMRKEIEVEFPEIAQNKAFLPIFWATEVQEILLSQQFTHYTTRKFQDYPKSEGLATQLLHSFRFAPISNSELSLVQRINIQRDLKDQVEHGYCQLIKVFDKSWVNQIICEAYEEFKNFYIHLDSIKVIKTLLEATEFNGTNKSSLNGIPINTGHDYQNGSDVVKIDNKVVLDNMLDGYILFNKRAEVLDLNRKATDFLHLSEKELKRTSVLDILPKELSEKLNKDISKTDSSTPNVVLGTRQEVLLMQGETILGNFEVSISNNYTEEDSYSIFLRNINNKIDSLKTIEEAKIHAERTAKAKSTFLSNMSHEIRTPLNVILGLSEIVSKNGFKDEVLLRKNIDGIQFSAQNLLSIVNDILDFSKIEAGKLTLQSIDFNIRKVFESLIEGFKIKASEKGLDLIANLDHKIPDLVVGDQYRLNQILTNLIGNAIKFTHEGSITIDVNRLSKDGDTMVLEFQVKDTGVGIEKDKLNKIFDSFYQVENPDSSKILGTGLGLAITKELIALQQGELYAESELNQGSTFKFTVTVGCSKIEKLAAVKNTTVHRDEMLKGLRVLVAEDNTMNQFYIKQLLNGLDVEVDIAENGLEAVNIYLNAEDQYDLILMDMHMPIMNGLEAVNIIRQTDKNTLKKIPIVACSADVFPEARKNAIRAGIDYYLTKPLHEDAVKEVLFWLVSDTKFEPTESTNNVIDSASINNMGSTEVNIDLLTETFGNDNEFIASLLEIFIKETPDDYNTMRTCVEQEFYARAASMAHKLKSSFMNLGMTQHGYHLQQIESNIIKRDGVEEAKKHLSAFSSLYTKALLEINIMLIEMRQS